MSEGSALGEYVCSQCGGTFPKGAWSEDEAWDEALDVFGGEELDREGVAIVCDDCYQAMVAVLPPVEYLARAQPPDPDSIEGYIWQLLSEEVDRLWAFEVHEFLWGVPCGPTLSMVDRG